MFAGGADLATAVEQVARIGARLLLLQTALEAEATEFLGRERYAGAATSPEAREGSRNGYCETARGLHAQRDSLLAQRDSLRAQRDSLRAQRDALHHQLGALHQALGAVPTTDPAGTEAAGGGER